MDGDGKDDYVYIGEHGALSVWYNRGSTDDSMAIDGLRFADIDGDGVSYLLIMTYGSCTNGAAGG